MEKRRYQRLSPSTWAEIRALWETGEPTLAELSARFGVRTRTLQAHFDKHGTRKGAKAKELAASVQAEIYSAMEFDKEARVKLGKEAQASAYRNAVAIEGLVMAQLTEAQKSPESAFKAATAIKTLSLAAQALERLSGIKHASLGLDQLNDAENDLPTLAFRDLSDAEIAKIREANGDDEADLDDVGDEPPEEGEAEIVDEVERGRLVRANCT